jgi:hypothetical protein
MSGRQALQFARAPADVKDTMPSTSTPNTALRDPGAPPKQASSDALRRIGQEMLERSASAVQQALSHATGARQAARSACPDPEHTRD